MAARAKENGVSHKGTKNRYWVSFDLGLTGNYSYLYEWLDAVGAEECGTGLATLLSSKTPDGLRKELLLVLERVPRARAYLIAPKENGKFSGSFVQGGRKAAPWTGYAESVITVADEA